MPIESATSDGDGASAVADPRRLLVQAGVAARSAALAAGVTLRNLDEDSAHFAVQVVRRLGWGRRLATGRGPAAWQVVAAHLADQPKTIAVAVEEWGHSAGRGPLDRLAAAAALNRGFEVPEALLSPQDRARLALQVGDYAGALAVLPPGSRLARKIASEREVMTPGVWPCLLPRRGPVYSPVPRSVLFVLTNSLPHTRSGYTSRSQAMMEAQQAAGWSVTAATRIGYPATIGRLATGPVEQVGTIPIHRLLPLRLPALTRDRLLAQARLLARIVEQERPAVLHTTTDHTNAVVVRAVAEHFGIPWVYEMRGQLELTWLAARPERLREQAASSERMALQRARETDCALRADAVVVLSEVQKADLVERGVPVQKITVVPNAVDESLFERDISPADARERLGLPREGHWVGAVSSLVDYEGFDTLLRAVALLRERGEDVRCALGGHGVSRPGLMALAEELGIAQWCEFPGRLEREVALQWVEALDVVAIPRKDTPVCRMVTPLKPVEAMALGRPVVGSDLPALRELLEPSGNVLVPAGDVEALAEAISTSFASKDGSQGQDWASERIWGRLLRPTVYSSFFTEGDC